MTALAEIATALREEGGLLADTVVTVAPDDASPLPADLAFAMEAVREGWKLHSDPDAARIVRTDDRDLALLAGDRLYALGVERLVAIGDLAAVAVLADVIALAARAGAEQNPALASAAFAAGERALASGDRADLDGLSQAPDIRQHHRFTDR